MDEPIQKRADRFERQIIDFLHKKLAFKDVNGGNTFRMGDIQVDACGGHEDTLLVFECHLSNKRSSKSIREKIQIFRGNIPILSKAFHKDPVYRKYKNNKFIITLKNIIPIETDYKFADEKPHQISIWSEQLIDYYSGLIDKIGQAAKYNLLGEIGVKPRLENIISVPALFTKLGNYNTYSFLVDPQKLIESAYVARRDFGKEQYYQRILKPDRIDNIKKYIQDGGFFPNNIIIAFTKRPKFTPFNEITEQLLEARKWLQFGILEFPADYRNCWIIDGQHRLYAFQNVGTSTKVAVIAFERMPTEIQAKYFIDINREQKPVDQDLIWDLQGEMRHNSPDGIVANTVKKLNSQAPLIDKIFIPLAGRRKRGQLKFSVICTSVKKRSLTEERTEKMERGGPKNPLYSNNTDKVSSAVAKALSAFFQQVDDTFLPVEKTELVYTNGGVSVLIAIFERMLSRINRAPSKDDYTKYVEALHSAISENFPDKQHRRDFLQRSYTEGGKTELVNAICLWMREYLEDDHFGGDIKTTSLETRIKQFERKLADSIVETIGAQSIEEFKTYAPPDLCGMLDKRLQKKLLQGKPTSLSEQLTLGECLRMLDYKDNWKTFAPLFITSQFGFGSIRECQGAIQAVIDLRNAIGHGRRETGKYRQQELANIYLEKLERCLEDQVVQEDI